MCHEFPESQKKIVAFVKIFLWAIYNYQCYCCCFAECVICCRKLKRKSMIDWRHGEPTILSDWGFNPLRHLFWPRKKVGEKWNHFLGLLRCIFSLPKKGAIFKNCEMVNIGKMTLVTFLAASKPFLQAQSGPAPSLKAKIHVYGFLSLKFILSFL